MPNVSCRRKSARSESRKSAQGGLVLDTATDEVYLSPDEGACGPVCRVKGVGEGHDHPPSPKWSGRERVGIRKQQDAFQLRWSGHNSKVNICPMRISSMKTFATKSRVHKDGPELNGQ